MNPMRSSLAMTAMVPALALSGLGGREKKKKVRRPKFVHHLNQPKPKLPYTITGYETSDSPSGPWTPVPKNGGDVRRGG